MVDKYLNLIHFEKTIWQRQNDKIQNLKNIHHGLVIEQKPMLAMRIFLILQEMAAAKIKAMRSLISLYDAEQQWQRQLTTMRKGKQHHLSLGYALPAMVRRMDIWQNHKNHFRKHLSV